MTGSDLRIVILGAGRMGRAVADVVDARADASIAAVVARRMPDWVRPGQRCGSLEELDDRPDLLIDFSLPEATRTAAPWCAANGVPLLSGVTGLDDAGHSALRDAAAVVPVLWSPNLSLGVNLLAALTGRAAAVIDPETPVEIDDRHHQWKKDAPSGTALMLGAEVAARRGGDDRRIAYASQREGEVIGEHTVRFRLDGEVLELTHRATDRAIYARGAVAAGIWLAGQAPGLFTARDWLSGACTQGEAAL